MVQTMETWFVADLEALKGYYGQGFNPNPIPKRGNVEEIEKDKLFSMLEESTRRTSKKAYHKVKHVPSLLGNLNEKVVREKALYSERLFAMLERIIDGPAPQTLTEQRCSNASNSLNVEAAPTSLHNDPESEDS